MLRQHRDLAEWSEGGQLFELNYFDPTISHVKNASDATPFHVRRLRVIVAVFLALKGKRRFLNKHPQNSYRIAFLRKIFPGAKFIHLVRDGRAVVASNVAQVRRDRYRQSLPFGSFPKPRGWERLLALPLSVQFVGRYGQEATLLRVAFGYERVTEWFRHHPTDTR